MYFLPRSNKFNAWIVTIKPLHLYFLTGLTLAAITGVWLFGVYFRLNTMIIAKHHEIAQFKQQVLQVKHMQDGVHGAQATVQKLQTTIDEHKNGVHHQVQSAMLFLINQAHQYGLTMQSCSADRLVDKEWYMENAVHVDLSGSYEHLLKFITSLSSSHHLVSIAQINMQRTSGDLFT